jgi:hypothetical protein
MSSPEQPRIVESSDVSSFQDWLDEYGYYGLCFSVGNQYDFFFSVILSKQRADEQFGIDSNEGIQTRLLNVVDSFNEIGRDYLHQSTFYFGTSAIQSLRGSYTQLNSARKD